MQKEDFEQLLNRHHDDSLERLEECMDAIESRLYSRFGDLEDKLSEIENNIEKLQITLIK